MGKSHHRLEADEHGFFTLPLPKPGPLDLLPLPYWLQRPPKVSLHLSPKTIRTIQLSAVACSTLLTLALLVGFFMPRSLHFSYSAANCSFTPQLLPRLSRHHASGTFVSHSPASLSVAGYPIFSHKTCVIASAAPAPNQPTTLRLSPLGLPLIHKEISVSTPGLPQPQSLPASADKLATGAQYQFTLDQADTTFSYVLKAAKKVSACEVAEDKVSCPLSPLDLKPGKSYDYTLQRMFQSSSVETMHRSTLSTLDPVVMRSSSIAKNATVYHKPKSIQLTFNKPLASIGDASLGKQKISTTLDGKVLTIKLGEELTRETDHVLRITQITATDGSQLLAPLALPFRTSGGPRVTGASFGSYKVTPYAILSVYFDSAPADSKDSVAAASIVINNKTIAASVHVSVKSLVINPSQALPRCTAFTVRIRAGLTNEHGVDGGKAWSLQSRTLCQVTFSIGSSVQGRGITAYRFGSGASRIVYVGGTHGNEQSSYYTLNGLIDYLESNPQVVPKHRQIIIIPNLNPDGFAAGTRTNANNVDLNRNFPSNDWQKSIQMPGGITLPKGGGNAPLDQPESKSLARYIQSIKPRLVLTYHAVARVVISNDSGDSISLAKQYAGQSGYPYTSNADSHGTFEYATTGEFEDWLADKESTPGLLIELSSMSSNQFYAHQSAMIKMAQLP